MDKVGIQLRLLGRDLIARFDVFVAFPAHWLGLVVIICAIGLAPVSARGFAFPLFFLLYSNVVYQVRRLEDIRVIQVILNLLVLLHKFEKIVFSFLNFGACWFVYLLLRFLFISST